MDKKKTVFQGLLQFLLLYLPVLLVQVIGGLITSREDFAWYETLRRAPWSPPNFLFAPVWTLLYLLMTLALFLVYRAKAPAEKKLSAYRFYFLQLFFNGMWTPLFFGLHAPFGAFIALVLLLVFLTGTLHAFFRVNHVAASLLFPYYLWSLFALSLNAAILYLN